MDSKMDSKEALRLAEQWEEIHRLLSDPTEKDWRRLRRLYLLGMASESRPFSDEVVVKAREIAGEEDAILFDRDWMDADGWELTTDTMQWSYKGDTSDPVELVERRLSGDGAPGGSGGV